MSVPWLLGTSVRLFLPFHCFSFARRIVCDKMLGIMVWWLDSVLFGTLAIPSNDVFCAATRTDRSYYFIDRVLMCAVLGWCPLGRIPVHVTLFGTRIIADSSTT